MSPQDKAESGTAYVAGLTAQDKASREPGSEEKAGCFSHLTLGWFTSYLKLGAKQQLTMADLGRPNPHDEGVTKFTKMQALWEAEVEKKGLKDASLARVARRFLGWRSIFTIVFLAYGHAISTTCLPMINKRILEWLEGSREMSETEQWLHVALIGFIPVSGAFMNSRMQLTSMRCGVHLFTGLTQMVYVKSLYLSPQARSQCSTGRLVNLMSNDAGNVMENAVKQAAPALTALPQVITIVVLLFAQLGLPMLAGFGFMLFTVPLSAVIFLKIHQNHERMSYEADTRLKFTNDLFTGIRVVKAYAWEKAFMSVIKTSRLKELSWLRRHAYWNMLGMMCVYMQLPQLMQLLVYTVFTATGGEFTAARIFTAIQLFQILTMPLSQVPQSLNAVATLRTAFNRLGFFLRLDELNIDEEFKHLEGMPEGDAPIISVSADAAFQWENDSVESWKLHVPKSRAEKKEEMAEAKKKKKAANAAEDEANGDGTTEKEANGNGTTEKEANGDEANAKDKLIAAGGAEAVLDLPAQKFKLKEIGFTVKRGELIAIVGSVGSGKTSLLSALLNEMFRISGSVRMHGSISYATQQPWIQNATLRDNILFGTAYDEAWYQSVIEGCALRDDLAMLEDGDLTEIGERGINLSGGQKARVGIARAVYANADLVMLDDPLAAVDMHVGDTLFNTCVCNMLKDKTVLLVTNQLHRLHKVDRILVLEHGSITEAGSFSELVDAKKDFADLLDRQGIVAQEIIADTNSAKSAVENELLSPSLSPNRHERKSQLPHSTVDTQGKKPGSPPKRLTEDEGKASGFVSLSVYGWFIRQGGVCLVSFVMITGIVLTGVPVGGSFILAEWSKEIVEALDEPGQDADSLKPTSYRWLRFYALCILGGFLSSCSSAISSAEARVRASRNIHALLLKAISRAPVGFFDITPMGRILNRFSMDMSVIDQQIMMMLTWTFTLLFMAFASASALVISTKGWLMIFIGPSLIMFGCTVQFVRKSAVQLQRLTTTTRAPLASTFAELLSGLSIVRAYKAQERFQLTNTQMMNQNVVPTILARVVMPAWLSLRMSMIGALANLFCGVFAVLAVKYGDGQTAGMAGVGFSFANSLSGQMLFCVFLMVQVETIMNSAERVKEYVEDTPSEGAEVVDGLLPQGKQWPHGGRIMFQDLVTGYRDGPDILKKINADIQPCEKIGIVGRTGSGKSTIILSIFRLIEPRSGTIIIDGIDITKVGLQQLRSNIGLIPQDPVLFTGTLRYNIDPFTQSSDEKLWETLKEVKMFEPVSRLDGGLLHRVQEGGSNFSVGERQLICIARALLRNPRVLCLDEATASVDNETDAMLQELVRTLFKKKTVITIAHRLDTIMDSDRIMVLDAGNLAEFGPALELLERPNGIFRSLVEAGNEEHLSKIARHGYVQVSLGKDKIKDTTALQIESI